MSKLKRLITEIHHRSLWQVLLIYVGAGWFCYEIIDTIADRMALPTWLPVLAIVLFLLGLPFVLATAFVREAEPAASVSDSGLITIGEARADRARHRPHITWRNAALSFVVALAVWGVVATGWVLLGPTKDESAAADDRPSVAVLPLVNRSGLEGDEYFTDGVHDEILTQLSKIAGLSVRGRTSVMQYRDSPKNLRQIGKELDAQYLLEGGVQRAGETVRINVQLVDSESDEHLWADTYDRELSVENLLSVQTEIAERVAESLEAALTPADRERIERRPTDNLEAYDYYSRARHLYYRYTLEGNASAIELYEQALEHDGNFALAFAGLSLCQSQYINRGWSDDEEWLARAEVSARRALAIDPELVEAHFALGFVHEKRGNDDDAEREMKTVLQGNPNHAHAHDSLGDVYLGRGWFDRALAQYEIALRLDPFLVPSLYLIGIALRKRGEYEEALRHYQSALQVNPNMEWYHIGIGDVLREKGDHSAAVGAYEAALGIAPDPDAFLGLARSLIALQELEAARSLADRLLSVAPERASMKAGYLYILGHIDLAQGDTENAIARFHEALELQPSSFIRRSGREHHPRIALAEANLANGEARIGARYLEEVLQDDPEMLILRYHLGIAHEAGGDSSKAVAEFRAFLNSWKDADLDASALIDAERRLAALESMGG